jgi:hypothetical protein
VLIGALVLLLLLNGGDDAPGRTAGAYDVLVGNGEEVTLINSKLATKLKYVNDSHSGDPGGHRETGHTLATSCWAVSMGNQTVNNTRGCN